MVLLITVKITKSLLRFSKERVNWKTASRLGYTGGSCTLGDEMSFIGHLTNSWNKKLVDSMAWLDAWMDEWVGGRKANPLGTCKPQVSLGMPDLVMHISHGDTLRTEESPLTGVIQRLARRWSAELDHEIRTCCIVSVSLWCRLENELKCMILNV